MWVKEAEMGETWYMLGVIKVVFMISLKWTWDQIDCEEVSQIALARTECNVETFGDLDADVPLFC
jgi:hypothetical protein